MRELRTKHYDSVVTTLIESIQQFWKKYVSTITLYSEATGNLDLDEDFDLSQTKEMEHDWQNTVKPSKRHSWKASYKKREETVNKLSLKWHNRKFNDLIASNIYRLEHGIQSNIKMREPDRWVKKAVDDSYVTERTRKLQQYSIDPNIGKKVL